MFGLKDLKLCKISNGALKGKDLPSRLKLFAWGENDSAAGKFTVNEKTAAGIAAQGPLGFERVAIDFNHCSVPGDETNRELIKNGQPPLIFGYGRPAVIPNDGLFLEDLVWTPLGQQHARNFEDLSPALHDTAGVVDGLHSVALTPNGKVHGLQFFSAKTSLTMADLGAIDNASHAESAWKKYSANRKDYAEDVEEKLMAACKKFGIDCSGKNSTQTANTMNIDIKLLSAALGLPETADEKTVTEKFLERIKGTAQAAPTASVITELSVKVADLTKRLDDQAKADTEAERERIIRTLAADGKAPKNGEGKEYSREELLKLDVETLKILAANTPVTVPITQRNLTSQMGEVKTFAARDKDGKVTGPVDLAGIFNHENARRGQTNPNAVN